MKLTVEQQSGLAGVLEQLEKGLCLVMVAADSAKDAYEAAKAAGRDTGDLYTLRLLLDMAQDELADRGCIHRIADPGEYLP